MSIESAIEKYMSSEQGQKRIEKCIESYSKSGKSTASGKKIVTKQMVYGIARELRSAIINVAKSYYDSGDISESVWRDITKLTIGDAVEDNNCYKVSLYFDADLHRDSVENGYSDWDGIDNIIALFNNGYSAGEIKQTFGYWENHKRTGSSFDMRDTGTDIWIPTKTERQGLHFINRGVSSFKAEYKKNKDTSIKIVVNKDYLKNK